MRIMIRVNFLIESLKKTIGIIIESVRPIRSQYRYHLLSRRAYRYARSGDFDKARVLLLLALNTRKKQRSNLAWASIIDLFFSTANEIYRKNETEVHNKDCRHVFLSGMGYTGSSAIHDFLRSSELVFEPFNGGEMDFIKHDYGLGWLYDKLIIRRGIKKTELIKFFFVHILGLSPSIRFTITEMTNGLVEKKALMSRFSVLKDTKIEMDLRDTSATFFNRLLPVVTSKKITQESIQAFEHTCSDFLAALITLPNRERRKIVLLNNWIPIHKVHYLNLFRRLDCEYLATHRSWADTYLSWSRESSSNATKLGVLYFFPIMCMRYTSYIKNRSIVKLSNNIHDVSFEKFVLSNNTREVIATTIGFDQHEYFKLEKSRSRFDPNVSRRNINIAPQTFAEKTSCFFLSLVDQKSFYKR